MPQLNLLGKQKKAHPTLIPDAAEPARLQFGACGSSESVGCRAGGEQEGPSEGNFFGSTPILDAVMSINLSALPIPLREGDSRGDYVMMTWLYALLVLSERYGPLQGAKGRDGFRLYAVASSLGEASKGARSSVGRRRRIGDEAAPSGLRPF